jgi:hypothetical protein
VLAEACPLILVRQLVHKTSKFQADYKGFSLPRSYPLILLDKISLTILIAKAPNAARLLWYDSALGVTKMEEKITIIEGPPPEFEPVGDGWALGLNESPLLASIVMTRLRTFNGPALVERCHRAWRNQQSIPLEYRSSDGLIQNAPIVAVRFVEAEEGHMLLLWVRMIEEEASLEIGYEDDSGEGDDSDLPDIPF